MLISYWTSTQIEVGWYCNFDFVKYAKAVYRSKTPRLTALSCRCVKAIGLTTVIERFYMSTPNRDGSFDNRRKQTEFIANSSLYKFEVIQMGVAKFSFIVDGINVFDAVAQPESLVEPVCIQENNPFMEARNIQTIEPGIVVLEGDIWRLMQKATIKYT